MSMCSGLTLLGLRCTARSHLRRMSDHLPLDRGNSGLMAQAPDFAQDHQIRLLQGTQEFFPASSRPWMWRWRTSSSETYIFDFTDSGAKVARF